MLVVICDIDRSLANGEHREHLLQAHCNVCLAPKTTDYCPICKSITDSKIPQSAWDAFMAHDLLAKDTVYPDAQKFVAKVRGLGAKIFYITGRQENTRKVTEKWLQEAVGRQDHEELVMRPDRGTAPHSPASVYKEQAFLALRAKHKLENEFFLFLEDDDHVIENSYSKFGIVIKCPEAWHNNILHTQRNKVAEPAIKR